MCNVLNSKKIYFAPTKEGVIIPSKREEDGAFDIYANFEEDLIVIRPHETVMIPTGLASAFSSDYVAILKERGSTGSKGIGQRCGVIDSGYRAEWFVPLTNHNADHLVIAKEGTSLEKIQQALVGNMKHVNIPFKLYPFEKAIAQCIMVEVPKLTAEEISYDDLLKFDSERGTGALGSSGK